MKKHLILTSLLAIVATTGVANATVETTLGQVKSNLETEFKQAPDATLYPVTAPNGGESNLSVVSESDYDNYSASTSADGDKVKINDTVSLNIAQGTVDVTDYQYKSFDADGHDSYVSGDAVVTDLNKDYTLADGVTVVNVSTSTSEAPAVSLKTASDEPVYKNADGTFYLAKDANGNIQLNGDANATLDNKASFDALMEDYNEDVKNVSDLYTELTGYKQQNQDNFAAVTTAKDKDNEAIQSIVANKDTYTTQNNKYNADNAANISYNGSVAQAIDNSIASAQTATLQDAKDYADGLASNYDAAGAAATAETKAKDYADSLASNYDAAGAAAAEETRALAAEGALDGRLTTAESGVSANAQAIANETARATEAENGLSTAIANEKTARENEDTAIRGEFAAADTATLNAAKSYTESALDSARAFANAGDAWTLKQANAYTNKKVDTLEKNVSGGVAAATALSAVSVANVGKGEVSVGGGYGYYNNQSAVAFGAAMGLSDSWSVNAGAGIASGDKTQFSIRAGANYKFKMF
jgi:hypothetical protein